uniref:Uncharacterized protein n=1 Tax=Cannabis sativa TaxID=3483 RepID=A0A803NV77_CANSA
MDSELENLRTTLITRLQELNQFKHSGSVRKGEIEEFQEFIEILESDVYRKPKSIKLKRKKKSVKEVTSSSAVDIHESLKIGLRNRLEKLDISEERFRKYNIPKRYQNGQKQPLQPYLERLQEFMENTWRIESKKKREKGYLSLRELMMKIDTSNDALAQCAFNCLSVDDVKSIVECLRVEEKNNGHESTVITTFGFVMCFFMDALELAGPSWSNNGCENKRILFDLDEEIEDDVVHHIVMEVLRLEVCICSPEFFPMMLLNDVFYSMATHIRSNVFKDKLEGVITDKINLWKYYIDQFQVDLEVDHYEECCSEMNFLRQVLEVGVLEICSADQYETLPTLMTNLVFI